MKKLLVLLTLTSSCFASPLDSLSNVGNATQCIKNCDPGTIAKVINLKDENAKAISTTACKTACANSCFAENMKNAENKSHSEIAAYKCKDSLKDTFKIN
ncbi:MAG: hypothetical protein PHC75_02345 [Burkholderiales bacterium]|nr:hypothetical protein [Burkholderiales bacterium]